jgi:hypothetical protein
LFPQLGKDGFVMDKVAEDRERFAPRNFQRERNGVFHAKAHPQVFSTDDFHIGNRNAGGETAGFKT